MVIGAVLFVVGLIGCCGAVSGKAAVLNIYFVIVLIVVILEIVIIVLGKQNSRVIVSSTKRSLWKIRVMWKVIGHHGYHILSLWQLCLTSYFQQILNTWHLAKYNYERFPDLFYKIHKEIFIFKNDPEFANNATRLQVLWRKTISWNTQKSTRKSCLLNTKRLMLMKQDPWMMMRLWLLMRGCMCLNAVGKWHLNLVSWMMLVLGGL